MGNKPFEINMIRKIALNAIEKGSATPQEMNSMANYIKGKTLNKERDIDQGR